MACWNYEDQQSRLQHLFHGVETNVGVGDHSYNSIEVDNVEIQ